MSAAWICPVCGCSSNHFSTSSCSLVCDFCRTEVKTEAERKEELNYQRNMALAKKHLKVGNWEEAKKLVKPYENSRPTDKRVYLYLLVATTKCFEDYLIDNPVASQEAEVYWNKLQRLGCVNPAMINYSDRRAAKLRAINDEFTAKKTLLIVINVVITVLAFSMMVCGEWIAILFIIFAVAGWSHSIRWIDRNKG